MYHMPFESECWLSELFDQDVVTNIMVKIKYEVEVQYCNNNGFVDIDHLELDPESIEIHVDGLGILVKNSWSVSQHEKILSFVRSKVNGLNLNEVIERLPEGDSKDYDDKEMWE